MSEFVNQKLAELEAVNAAIADVIQNGEAYAVQGSHSVTKVKLADLHKEKSRIVKELTAYLRESGSGSYTEVPKYDR